MTYSFLSKVFGGTPLRPDVADMIDSFLGDCDYFACQQLISAISARMYELMFKEGEGSIVLELAKASKTKRSMPMTLFQMFHDGPRMPTEGIPNEMLLQIEDLEHSDLDLLIMYLGWVTAFHIESNAKHRLDCEEVVAASIKATETNRSYPT